MCVELEEIKGYPLLNDLFIPAHIYIFWCHVNWNCFYSYQRKNKVNSEYVGFSVDVKVFSQNFVQDVIIKKGHNLNNFFVFVKVKLYSLYHY